MSRKQERASGAKQYWREADARRALSAYERSGLSLREYCRKSGVSERKLRRWQSRLAAPSSSVPAFREVRMVPGPAEASPEPDFAGEVIVGAYRVRAPLGFDAAELRRLLDAVTEC